MAEKAHAPQTPPPRHHGDDIHYLVDHPGATSYSSGAEFGPTDLSSSRGTSYGSPNMSWGLAESGRPYEYYGSPLTPLQGQAYRAQHANQRSESPTTRNRSSGRSRGSPTSRQTTSSPASVRSRKPKSNKTAKVNNINLDAPLSVLTRDSAVPLKDMESFVNRSAEERMKEKEKKNGYIVRPMNAFMLYRSAYADRAKNLFAQNNHQIVSKATGQSWRMEPKEIQDHYKQLAEIERDNHAKAWPNYKFAPAKAAAVSRKRKESEFGSDDDGTEQDISDYDWTPSGTRKPRPSRASNRQQLREKSVGSPYPQYGRVPYFPPPPPSMNASPYGVSHLGHGMAIPVQEMHGFEQGPGYYHPGTQYFPEPTAGEIVHFEPASYGSVGMVGAPNFGPPELSGVPSEDPFVEYHPYQGPGYYGYIDPKLEDFRSMPTQGMFTEDGFEAYHGDLLAQQAHQAEGEAMQAAGPSLTDMFNGNDDESFRGWVDEVNQQ